MDLLTPDDKARRRDAADNKRAVDAEPEDKPYDLTEGSRKVIERGNTHKPLRLNYAPNTKVNGR